MNVISNSNSWKFEGLSIQFQKRENHSDPSLLKLMIGNKIIYFCKNPFNKAWQFKLFTTKLIIMMVLEVLIASKSLLRVYVLDPYAIAGSRVLFH